MVNLWKTDGFFEAPCETVAGLMARFGHQSLSLLKIAADGSEWRVLESVLAAGIRTDVLCVVFCQPSPFWRVAAMIRRLRRAGLRCVARDEWKFTFVREAALSGVATQPVETHAA
jgi:hypothetical protein